MLTPGQTTLGNIRATVRQRADMVNTQFVTDAELNGYISASYFELYDIIIQKFGDDYESITPPFPITTVANTQLYALPSDFYKLLGVDLQINSNSPNGWLTLKPFMFAERNRNSFPNVQAGVGYRSNLRYRLNGNNLWLTPTPQAGQALQLWYIPRPTFLSDTGTITLSEVVLGNTVTLNGVTFIASAGTLGINFAVGGTDTITAANLVTVINQQAGSVSALAGISAVSSGPVVTITLTAGSVVWSGVSTFTFALPDSPSGTPGTWGTLVDGVSGWEEYIVADAAIKCLEKEESDTSVQMAQKQALLLRIEAAAENRDAGAPQVVSDTRNANGRWGGMGLGLGDNWE